MEFKYTFDKVMYKLNIYYKVKFKNTQILLFYEFMQFEKFNIVLENRFKLY